MLDLVRVFLRVGVNPLHSDSIRGTSDTSLRGVDVVVQTVEKTNSDHSRDTLQQNLYVLNLIDLSWSHGVIAQRAHAPTDRAALLAELGVQSVLTLSHEFFVGCLVCLS